MDRAKPPSQDGQTATNVDHAVTGIDTPAAEDAAWYRRADFLFGLVLFAAAVAALAVLSPGNGLHGLADWTRAAFFLAFSLFTISIGYPHPAFGHVSFDRVAQVSSILVLGAVEAGWIACLTSLLYPLHRLRRGVPREQVIDASITNAGLMTLVVLGAGLLYERLGGPVPLRSLDLMNFGLALLLIVVMQVINELGMVGIYYFRSKRPGQVISLFETMTELVSGLIAVLVAIVYTQMETSVFVLLLAVLAMGMLGLKQFADMRRHLEQLVEARTEALQEKTEQLEEMAIRDVLTGLRNRRAAEDFLQAALDEARRYGRGAERGAGRHRPLQADQRRSFPRDRRRGAQARGADLRRPDPRHRPDRPLRWRGVPVLLHRDGRGHGRAGLRRPAPCRGGLRLVHRIAGARGDGQHRRDRPHAGGETR